MSLEITNSVPEGLLLGIHIYEGLRMPPPEELKNYIHGQLEKIHLSHSSELPPGYTFSRKLYRYFKVDPTRHRPSSESLWRRLKKKGDFPEVNPVVDLTNLLSLKFQVSYGLYDLFKLSPPIQACIGTEEDHYEGIRKDHLQFNGKLILKDQEGAFGNPSSDSLRTSTHDEVTHILQVLFLHPEQPDAHRIWKASAEIFTTYFKPKNIQSQMIPAGAE